MSGFAAQPRLTPNVRIAITKQAEMNAFFFMLPPLAYFLHPSAITVNRHRCLEVKNSLYCRYE